MNIEEAQKEMELAMEAMETAKQHLIEAAKEETKCLSDIRMILGSNNVHVEPDRCTATLPAPKKAEKKTERKTEKRRNIPTEELQQELKTLEAVENPTREQTSRKAQVRYMLKKRGVSLENKPDPETQEAPSQVKEDKNEVKLQKYKVLLHEKGVWRIHSICNSKDEAEKAMINLQLKGQDARIKRME